MKKKKDCGRRSPTARVLSDRLWHQRVVKSKKIYSRKKQKPPRGAFDFWGYRFYKVLVTMCVGLASGNPYPHMMDNQM